MFKYSISIKWSDEDNGFIATVPELPGLSAFGGNQVEALSELGVAAQAYLESLKKSGKPVPDVEKAISFSGQLRLRMPKSLHANLADSARNEGVSLNTYIITLLSKRQIAHEISNKLADIEKMIWTTSYVLGSTSDNKAQPLLSSAPPVDATQLNLNGGRPN